MVMDGDDGDGDGDDHGDRDEVILVCRDMI